MVELWDILDKNGNVTGRVHERGKPMNKGEFHLEVYVWIENDNGEYLISQRSLNKTFPNMWECTGGNAVVGDDSLTTALKEAKEELKQTFPFVIFYFFICKTCLFSAFKYSINRWTASAHHTA